MKNRIVIAVAFVFVVALPLGMWRYISTSPVEQVASDEPSAQTMVLTPSNDQPTTRPQPNPTTSNNRQIIGRVRNSAGAGIDAADVLINVAANQSSDSCQFPINEFELNDNTHILQTNSQGEFALALASAEDCLVINVAKEGYSDSLNTYTASQQNLEIVMLEQKRVSGRVYDPNGQAIAGATVKVWFNQRSFIASPTSACSEVQESTVQTTVTNQRGEFDVLLAQDVNYCLVASHPNWASSEPQWVNINLDLVVTVPSAQTIEDVRRNTEIVERHRQAKGLPDQAVILVTITLEEFLEAGQAWLDGSPQLDVDVFLNPTLSLNGLVQDNRGNSAPNIRLTLQRQNDSSDKKTYTTESDVSGHFMFADIDTGTYRLTSPNPRIAIAEPADDFVIDETMIDFPVQIFSASLITGRVVNANGEAIENAAVMVRSPFATSASTTEATTDPTGNFTLSSHHLNPQVLDTKAMAATFLEDNSDESNALELCLEVNHPQQGQFRRSLQITDLNTDIHLDTIFMRDPPIQLRGKVFNRIGNPTAANLVFRSQVPPSSANMPTCADLQEEYPLATNRNGEFVVRLNQLGAYEVEINTDDVWQKKIAVDVRDPAGVLELRLD